MMYKACATGDVAQGSDEITVNGYTVTVY